MVSIQRMDVYLISEAPIVRASVQAAEEPPLALHPLWSSPGNVDVPHHPKAIWQASRIAPYDRLPRTLARIVSWPPSTPGGWEPPTFHYGWRPNVERLLAFAKERGLTVTCADGKSSWLSHHPSILRPQLRNKLCLYEVHFDEFGNTIRPRPDTDALWPPVDNLLSPADLPRTIDVCETISAALRQLMREALEARMFGEWCTTLDIALTLRVDDGKNFLVSVMNSYNHLALWDRNEDISRPSLEDMYLLAIMLGVSGPPKWYVDRDRCQWVNLSRQGHLREGRRG